MALTEDEEFELLSLEREKSTLSSQPVERPGIIQETMQKTGMDLSPQGLLGMGFGLVQEGAGKLGEKVKEILPKTGIKPLFARESIPVSQGVANIAGNVVKYSPDIAMMTAPASPAILKDTKLAKGAGRLFAGGIEKTIGIPAENVSTAFNKPTALFTAPTKGAVSKAYAQSELPDVVSNLDEIIKKGTQSASSFVKKGGQAVEDYVEGGQSRAKDIFEARQALDKQIATLESQLTTAKRSGKGALRNSIEAKQRLRETFNLVLDKIAPKLRQADSMASERFGVSPFRDITLPGKISFTSPEGVLRAVPGLPTAVGSAISGAGAVTQAVGKATPPVANRMLKKRKLDKETARMFYEQAGGDKEEARRLAAEAGY